VLRRIDDAEVGQRLRLSWEMRGSEGENDSRERSARISCARPIRRVRLRNGRHWHLGAWKTVELDPWQLLRVPLPCLNAVLRAVRTREANLLSGSFARYPIRGCNDLLDGTGLRQGSGSSGQIHGIIFFP
jgi:hypothetical protein